MLFVRCLCVYWWGVGGYEKSLGVCWDGEMGTNKLSHLMPGSQIGSLRVSQPLKVSADKTASTNKQPQVSGETNYSGK